MPKNQTKKCGLCGATNNLTKTSCCNNWICDDADQYVLFSYARNSCYRNHDRFTLCSAHYHEEHAGTWQKCTQCPQDYETEMYVWYGTNEYNFEVLKNPPQFKPTHCVHCKRVISLSEDGYAVANSKYYCEKCADEQI
jgi:hypothetical protein